MKCPKLWKKFFLRQTNKLNICVFLTDIVVVTLENTCWAIILKLESIVLELLGIDICTSVPCIVCLETLPGRTAANKTDKAWKRTFLSSTNPLKIDDIKISREQFVISLEYRTSA